MTAFAPLRRIALAALLALPAVSAAPPAHAQGVDDAPARSCGLSMAVVNEAARPVQELFVRPSGSPGWGADLLGDAVLRPGQSFAIAPAGAAPLDVMVLLADGTARALWRVDACAARRVTLTAALALRVE